MRYRVKDVAGVWSKKVNVGTEGAPFTKVVVTSVNDAPILAIVSGNATYVEGTPRSPPIFASASITDPDSDNMLLARIHVKPGCVDAYLELARMTDAAVQASEPGMIHHTFDTVTISLQTGCDGLMPPAPD